MSDPNTQSTSPLALVSLVTGIVGLVMSFVGCMFSPILFVACVLCLMALTLGFVEFQNVNAGKSAPGNKAYAVAGMASGAGGCAVGILYGLFVMVIFVLYFAFVAFVLLASAAGAGGP